MLLIPDILELFDQLEKTAHDPNHILKSGARLLCDKYLSYLRAKEQNPEEKAGYFKSMLKNFENKPMFNSEIIKQIYDDLNHDGGKQHLELLKDDETNLIAVLEEMRENYRDYASTQNQALLPPHMHTRYDYPPSIPILTIVPQGVITPSVIIQPIFENDVEKTKGILSYLLALESMEYFIEPFSNHYGSGFDRLYRFIHSPDNYDQQLKRLSIRVLARFKPYFAKNHIYIQNNQLVRSLFDTLGNEGPELDDQVFQALALCSSDCFTENDMLDLDCMLSQPNRSLFQRYYALLCLVSASREKHPCYFPQTSYPTMLIEVFCNPKAYPLTDGENRLFFLTLLFDLLSEMISKRMQPELIPNDTLFSLLRFSISHLNHHEIPTFIQVITAIYVYNKRSNLYFETGTIEFLLAHLESQECDDETFISIVAFIAQVSISDDQTKTFCTENKLYHQVLAFWSKNQENIQDEDQQSVLFQSLNKLFYLDFHRTPCSDEATVDLMFNLLPSMPQLAVTEHLLSYFSEAFKQNTAAIQARKKIVFQSMGYWLKNEHENNQIRILDLISTHLKEETEALCFIDSDDGYLTMKKLLHDQDPVLVQAAIRALSKLISYSKIANNLFSDTPFIYKIGDLSNYSKDTDTRHYATVILDSINRMSQNHSGLKNAVPRFFGLNNRNHDTLELNQGRHFHRNF